MNVGPSGDGGQQRFHPRRQLDGPHLAVLGIQKPDGVVADIGPLELQPLPHPGTTDQEQLEQDSLLALPRPRTPREQRHLFLRAENPDPSIPHLEMRHIRYRGGDELLLLHRPIRDRRQRIELAVLDGGIGFPHYRDVVHPGIDRWPRRGRRRHARQSLRKFLKRVWLVPLAEFLFAVGELWIVVVVVRHREPLARCHLRGRQGGGSRLEWQQAARPTRVNR